MVQLTNIAEYVRTEWLFILRMIVQIGFSFGMVVFIHELGHFLAAKLVKVGATDFALGMGPEIYGFQWGETRCKLCLFPIGGYVKLIGEDTDDVPPELAGKNLREKKTWQKVLVIFAGPFMNFVLAVILNMIILMAWGVPRALNIDEADLKNPTHMAPTVIAGFVDPREPAGKGGLKTGDTILAIDNTQIASNVQVKQILNGSGGKTLGFSVKREHKILSLAITPRPVRLKNPDTEKMENDWQIGIGMVPPTPRVVDKVSPGSAAALAGIAPGDIILDFDRQDFQKENNYAAAEPVTTLTLYRAGAPAVVKKLGPDKLKPGQDTGITLLPINHRLNPFAALIQGTSDSVLIISLTVDGIRRMINRELSASSISGPIGIIQYASTFARSGLRDFIFFFAVISVSLGFINLVPFPALDGSIILFFLWEGITRRPINPRAQGIIISVGFSILIGLIILISLRDLRLWLGF